MASEEYGRHMYTRFNLRYNGVLVGNGYAGRVVWLGNCTASPEVYVGLKLVSFHDSINNFHTDEILTKYSITY